MKITITHENQRIDADIKLFVRKGNVIATGRLETKSGPIMVVSVVPKRALREAFDALGGALANDQIGGFWDNLKKFAKSKAVQGVLKTLAGIGKNPQAMAALSAIPYAGPVLAGGATAAAAMEPAANIYERVRQKDPKAIENVRMLARNAPFNPVAQKALTAIAKAKDFGTFFEPQNAAFVGGDFNNLRTILRQLLAQ